MDYDVIQKYLIDLVPPRPQEMQDMEEFAAKTNFPIIGPAAGYACYQIARMNRAQSVFEMGSGYGYSTAWFAKAVQETCAEEGKEGVVHHVVWDEGLSRKARLHLGKLGYENLIEYHVAEAIATLRDVPGPFDLIFNDIDKKAYPDSLPVIKEKLRPGGVLLVDNMLWSARIFDQRQQDESTQGIRRLTELITEDPDWIVTLLPIRDGVMVALKK